MENFKNTFDILANSSSEDVRGVLKYEGRIPGPCVGITVCTHGNEPSGLAAAQAIMAQMKTKTLTRGTLYLVINNIDATRAYLNAHSEKEKIRSRYIDINMNRLPKNVLELAGDVRYEVRRAQELAPIWKRFEIALDIHSTTGFSEPMIITNGGNLEGIKDLLNGFPMSILLSEIDFKQIGMPAASLYGDRTKKPRVFAIEAGQHTLQETYIRAEQCAIFFLQNAGLIDGTPALGPDQLQEYLIEDSIVFSDLSFDFVKNFETFDVIKKGETLARNRSGKEVKAPFDGHIIMPTPRRGADKNISEEVAFLSRPVRRVSMR